MGKPQKIVTTRRDHRWEGEALLGAALGSQ